MSSISNQQSIDNNQASNLKINSSEYTAPEKQNNLNTKKQKNITNSISTETKSALHLDLLKPSDVATTPIVPSENPISIEKIDNPNQTIYEEIDHNRRNKFWAHFSDKTKPINEFFTKGKNPFVFAGIGAVLHGLDGFSDLLNFPVAISKVLRNSSVQWSKYLTSAPNVADAGKEFAKNDLFSGVGRLFPLLKIKFNEPGNFSTPMGIFLESKLLKFLMKNRNITIPKSFDSLGHSIKFYANAYKNIIVDSFKQLYTKNTKTIHKIDAAADIITNIFLPASSIVGTVGLKSNELVSAKAKMIGGVRNFAGLTGDYSIIRSIIKSKTDQLTKQGEIVNSKTVLKECIKDPEFLIGLGYGSVSISELLMRYMPEPVAKAIAQINLSTYESLSLIWGMMDNHTHSKDKTNSSES